MTELTGFALGDNVLIPWGLDRLQGRVVGTVVRGDGVDVDVSVFFPGNDEPDVVTVDSTKVEALDEPERDRNPEIGGWLDAFHYHKAVSEALEDAISSSGRRAAMSSRARIGRGELDFVAEFDDGRAILAEVKRLSPASASSVDKAIQQLKRMMSQWSSEHGSRVAGLVLFSEVLPSTKSRYLDFAEGPVVVSYWRGAEDNQNIAEAVDRLAH